MLFCVLFSQAYKEGKKERPPFSQDPEPVAEKPEIPEDLLCNICKDLLTDAVMIPCCGNSFCDECKSFIKFNDKFTVIKVFTNFCVLQNHYIYLFLLQQVFVHFY